MIIGHTPKVDLDLLRVVKFSQTVNHSIFNWHPNHVPNFHESSSGFLKIFFLKKCLSWRRGIIK